MAGEIVHLEIPSRSFERSASFYEKLFGWRTDGQQAGGHLRFEIPGAAAGSAASTTGSLVRSALAQATGPLPFVAVDDIDRTLAEAERQGGRVLARRLPLAGRGHYGLLADVDGNLIAVVADEGAAEKGAGSDKKGTAKSGPTKSGPTRQVAGDAGLPAAGRPPATKTAATPATKPAAKPATKLATKPSPSRKR